MADTNTIIFSSKLINLDRLSEFWTKAKEYIAKKDGELATALSELSQKHDAHEIEFNNHETEFINYKNTTDEWKGGINAWKTGTVDPHIAAGDIHVTAKQKEDWQAATDAINAFLDETATNDKVIDTLKEIQTWLGSGEGDAAAGLISRVGALEDKIDGALGTVGDVAKAISDAIDAHNIAKEAHANRFTAIDEKFDDYYTKGECDAKFATKENVAATYATKTEMGEVSTKVDTEVGKVSTKVDTEVGKVNAKFADYYTQSEVNTKVGEVDAKFANYYTQSEVNTKVGEVSTKVDTEVGKVDAKFADYYTQSEVNTKVGEVSTKVDTEVGKVDAKFAGYYTKTEIDKITIATTAEVEGLFA